MKQSWTDFLQGSGESAHGVQVYRAVDELADSVATYLAAGFEAGEPAAVVVARAHWPAFAARLADRGWEQADLERDRALVVADSEATLAAIMEGPRPSAARFETVVGGLLDRVAASAPGRRLRAFGDMVDLLSKRDAAAEAAYVEHLWNGLARRRDFSLLCGYELDIFDRKAQAESLPGICGSHSHVQPAHDPARLARAVDRALEDVLGEDEAGKVYVLIGDKIRQGRVPVAQLALMWVSRNLPTLAERVLAAARAYYAELAPAA